MEFRIWESYLKRCNTLWENEKKNLFHPAFFLIIVAGLDCVVKAHVVFPQNMLLNYNFENIHGNLQFL